LRRCTEDIEIISTDRSCTVTRQTITCILNPNSTIPTSPCGVRDKPVTSPLAQFGSSYADFPETCPIGVGAQCSVDFRGHDIFARKICMKNSQNSGILHDFCQKCPNFYIIILLPKNIFPNFRGNVPHYPPPFVSYAYDFPVGESRCNGIWAKGDVTSLIVAGSLPIVEFGLFISQ